MLGTHVINMNKSKINTIGSLEMDATVTFTPTSINTIGFDLFNNAMKYNVALTSDIHRFQAGGELLASISRVASNSGSLSVDFTTSNTLTANEILDLQTFTNSLPSNGNVWLDLTSGLFQFRQNDVTVGLGGGGGASTTLDNLVSPTAINQDLLPDGSGSRDLGNPSFVWAQLNVATIQAPVTIAIVSPTVSITGPSLVIGDAATDKVNFISRIDSDFTPLTDNTRDLGEGGLEWRNLRIAGTASIDTLSNTVPIIVSQDFDLATNVIIDYDQSVSSTSANAGVNGDVPSQVVGYLVMKLSGANMKIPFYAV